MTDEELARAAQLYFSSPQGKAANANQQLGVDKYNAFKNNNSFFAPGSPGWAASVVMGGAAAGGGLGDGLSNVSLPSSAKYLPSESMSSAASSTLGMTAPTDVAAVGTGGAGAGGFSWQNLKNLFHTGGGSKQQTRYANPIVADYSQQQQAIETLADALKNKQQQPVNTLVPGGPVTVKY